MPLGAVLVVAGLVLGLTFTSAQPAAARTLYVASDGDDARDCLTPATACRSFDRGYHAAAPGDRVEVAGGSYPAQAFSPDASKTSPDDVVVDAAPGARVVVGCPSGSDSNCVATEKADHLTVKGITTAMLSPVGGKPRQGGVALDRGSDDVTFQDFDAGHVFIGASNSRVIGGDYGPTVDAVSKITEEVGPNVLIDGAFFHDYLSDQSHMECIALYGARGVTIRRSRFDTCWNFAIFSTPEADQAFYDVLIENNFFSNSGDVPESAHVKIGSHGGSCTNFLMRYNTFVDRGAISDCGAGAGTATNIRWVANIFESLSGCTEGVSVFSYSVSTTGTRCETNVVVGDQRFANRPALDLRLTASSPAVGRGDPAGFPATDIDGNPRPFGSAPDAGADEYGSTGGTPPTTGTPGQGGGVAGGLPSGPVPGATGAPPSAAADTTAPSLRLLVPRRAVLRGRSGRRLVVRARCSEPCLLALRLVAGKRAAKRLGLRPGARRTVRLGGGRRALAALRTTRVGITLRRRAARALRRGPSVTLRLLATAADTAGNRTPLERRVVIRRR